MLRPDIGIAHFTEPRQRTHLIALTITRTVTASPCHALRHHSYYILHGVTEFVCEQARTDLTNQSRILLQNSRTLNGNGSTTTSYMFFLKKVHGTSRHEDGAMHTSTHQIHARPAPGTFRRSLLGPRSGTAITGFSTVTGIDSKFRDLRRS